MDALSGVILGVRRSHKDSAINVESCSRDECRLDILRVVESVPRSGLVKVMSEFRRGRGDQISTLAYREPHC